MTGKQPFTYRRQFLKAGLYGLAGGALGLGGCVHPGGRPLGARSRTHTRRNIGVAAITVIRPFAEDPVGTLKEIAAIGYRTFQTLGSLGLEHQHLADLLAETELTSPSRHVCPPEFYRSMVAWDAGQVSMNEIFGQVQSLYTLPKMPYLIEQAIAGAHVLGQKTIVWSNFLDADLATSKGVGRIIDALNAAGRQCAEAGLSFAIHNGSKGFAPIDGISPYDRILDETDPDLVRGELDIYWASRMGIDPARYLTARPGRYISVHLKDMDSDGNIVAIGEGVLDVRNIIELGEASGVGDFLIEYDRAPNPKATLRTGWDYLS